MHAPSYLLVVLLCSAFVVFGTCIFIVFSLPPLPLALVFIFDSSRCYLLCSFSTEILVSLSWVLRLGLGLVGGAHGWGAGTWAGLWGVLRTWVWVGSTSPQAPGHPTFICDIALIKVSITRRCCTTVSGDLLYNYHLYCFFKVWELTANGVVMVSAIGNDGPLYG